MKDSIQLQPHKLIWKYFSKIHQKEIFSDILLSLKSGEDAKGVAKRFLKREEEIKGNCWICYTLLSLKDLSAVAHKERFIV